MFLRPYNSSAWIARRLSLTPREEAALRALMAGFHDEVDIAHFLRTGKGRAREALASLRSKLDWRAKLLLWYVRRREVKLRRAQLNYHLGAEVMKKVNKT